MAIGDPYVSGDDLSEYIAGGTTAEAEDALTRAAGAASRWVEGHCRRQFNKADAATARVFRAMNTHRLWVDDIADDTVTIGDGDSFADTWETTDFTLEPIGAITNGVAGEPYTLISVADSRRFGLTHPALVQVTATWGWPEVPEDVKLATLIQGAVLFKRRESANGVLGGNDFGIVRIGARIDPDVEHLLSRYVRVAVA